MQCCREAVASLVSEGIFDFAFVRRIKSKSPLILGENMFYKAFRCVSVTFCVVVVLFLSTVSFGQVQKTAICHATSSAENPFNFLELPPASLDDHIDNETGNPLVGHEQDFFPVDNDCDKSNDPGGPGPSPDPIPEPITMLLFGAGLAGVGYASRRFMKKSKKEDSTEV